VGELSTPNPPLGILQGREFISSRVECSSGDIAILLTDGLTEVMGEREEEYGLERIKQLIATHAAQPLKVICEALFPKHESSASRPTTKPYSWSDGVPRELASGSPPARGTIEGEGVTPDIEVENDPASVIAGKDPQLDRGVAEVMKAMAANPRSLPRKPADPVKTPAR
jgi:hypothetical protein